METKYLEEFIHLSKTASFTKTSIALNISQPTLSRHIAMLENEFGHVLLDRNTRMFHVTPAGLTLLNNSYEILRLLDRAKQEACDMKRVVDHVMMGGYYYTDCIRRCLLRTAANSIRNELPFKVEVYEPHTSNALLALRQLDVIDDLRAGLVDVLLVPLPENSPLHDEFDSEFIYREPLEAWISQDSLIPVDTPVSLRDLESQFFLQGASFPLVNDCINDMFRRCLLEAKIRMRVADTEAEYYHLRYDEVTFLTSNSAKSRIGSYPYVNTCILNDREAYFDIYALCRKNTRGSVTQLINLMKESAVECLGGKF